MAQRTIAQVYEDHLDSGKFIQVNGINTFLLDWGANKNKDQEVVFCLHGVPTSSFLYRKVLKELADKGYRAICLDLPGLGLSDRPEAFDYTFSGFAGFCADALKVLGIQKYHLVVHDIGGPIGFALAARQRQRVASLSIMNTWLDVVNFKKPLPMRPFQVPGLQHIQLAAVTHTTWQALFKLMGVSHYQDIPKEEVDIYVDLLKRGDGGEAFLKIMRNFEDTPEFRDLCYSAVQDVPYPVQAIWGAEDPALTYDRYGTEVKEIARLDTVHQLSAKHFLQEDQAPEIARLVDALAKEAAASLASH